MLDDLSVFNPSHFNAVQQDDSIRWGYSEDLPDVPNPDACSVDDKVCFGDEIVIEHFDELKRGEIRFSSPLCGEGDGDAAAAEVDHGDDGGG